VDLDSYIRSELEEEEALGIAGPAALAPGGGYPGDPAVYLPEADVAVGRVRLVDDGVGCDAYVAAPAGGGSAPAVIVVHENKGLVPYIENVARRLAVRGYVAVAPDLLTRVGGTGGFERPSDVTQALREIDDGDVVADVRAVVAGAAGLDGVRSDRLGILGFCYGGGVAWRVMTKEPRLQAGVPFYGPIPELDAVPGLQAAVLAVYGGLDERITSMRPAVTEAMARCGKTFESLVLPDAQHAFHNDCNPDRYDAGAARTAEEAAVHWLDRWLKDG
jgi:carboxymethylenebutenolidase